MRNFHWNETAQFDRVGPKCISAGQQPPQFFNLLNLKVRFLCCSSPWGCFGNWQDRKFSLEVFQYCFFFFQAQIDGRFVCVANGISVDHRVKLLAEMSQLVFSPAARGRFSFLCMCVHFPSSQQYC